VLLPVKASIVLIRATNEAAIQIYPAVWFTCLMDDGSRNDNSKKTMSKIEAILPITSPQTNRILLIRGRIILRLRQETHARVIKAVGMRFNARMESIRRIIRAGFGFGDGRNDTSAET
jgi:hypothetical protein